LPANTDATIDVPVRLRADESAALLEIAQAAGSTLELHVVLDRVVERTAKLTGADRCSLWLLDSTHDLLLPAAIFGIDPSFAARWKRRVLTVREERLSQEAIATRQPVVVVDAKTDPRTDKNAVDFFGDKSFIVVPLATKGRVIGTLFLNHISHPYQYSLQEIAVIQAIASQSAVAIENAQLYEESRRQRSQVLASFRRIGDALAAGLNLVDTLNLVAKLATEMVGATLGVLTLSTDTGATADVYVVPADATVTYASTLAVLPDLAGRVIARGEPLYVSDLNELRSDGLGSPSATLRTYAGVPLRLRGETIGALGMYHPLPKRFSPAEVDLLASFGAQAAIAIDNARLFTHLQRKVEELSAAADRNAELYANLELEKQRLDVIFRDSSDAIFMADGEGRLVVFNPAAEVLTGWSAAEAIGRSCGEVFPGPTNGHMSLPDATAEVITGATSRSDVVEATITTRHGERRHVGASYAFVPRNNGEGPFALAVVRDISQQKEVERLKADFISMVSHELRTPLAIIKGYAATLLNTSITIDPNRQQRFLKGINDASDRLTRLIDNLLSVSRLESGRFKLNLQVIDLVDVIRRVVTTMRASANRHEIRFSPPPTSLPIYADHDQIEQVMVNLLSNAMKYSPEGGPVVVEVGETRGPLPIDDRDVECDDQAWTVVSVRDRGIGIPASQQRLIFDKFYRGDAPAARRVAGTGLGLFICRSIVEAHRGHIWVESSPGRGSTFYVAIPLE
jgi:PAS domain S-box-containing protein